MKYDKLSKISDKGYMTTSDLKEAGYSDAAISRFAESGVIYRVSRGIYSLKDDFIDDMLILQNKCGKGVFSHESALFLHNLTDKIPEKHVMTVPRSYNTNLDKKYQVMFRYVDVSVIELGKITMKTPCGHNVFVYNTERTICDVIRSYSKMYKYEANRAIREYIKTANLNKLMEYAVKMKIEKIVSDKLEVLL